MKLKIDWRAFIEDNFIIQTKIGQRVPFKFNAVQNEYYDYLIDKYGLELEGVRENIVKGRQQGFSSLIDGLKVAKFLLSIDSGYSFNAQIISHKAEETKPLFKRVNLFVDSYLEKQGVSRKSIFAVDNSTSYFETHSELGGSSLFVGTAGAKTLGRGGTLQAIHWSEVAFYPDTQIMNAAQLVTGAEQQVLDGTGMIFRESTGNMVGDLMYKEYFKGLDGKGDYGSVFIEWYKTENYVKKPPKDYNFDSVPILDKVGYTYDVLKTDFKLKDDQIYWWIKKLENADDPKTGLREYPMVVEDAFLASGEYYFEPMHLKAAKARVTKPLLVAVGAHELSNI